MYDFVRDRICPPTHANLTVQAVFADLHDFPSPDDLARLGMRVAHAVWGA